MRAIVGHLARAGVVQPDAVARPTASPAGSPGAWDGRALALCRTSAQEGTRVRWRQYRAVWAWVEGDEVPARGDPAPLRRPLGARARRARAATSAIPSLAPAPPPPPAPRPRRTRPAQLAHRPAAEGDLDALDEAILDVVASAQPEVGRTRAVEILRGGRSKVVEQVLLRRAAALRRVVAPAPRRRCSAGSTRCSTAGTLRSTGGRFPKLEVA